MLKLWELFSWLLILPRDTSIVFYYIYIKKRASCLLCDDHNNSFSNKKSGWFDPYASKNDMQKNLFVVSEQLKIVSSNWFLNHLSVIRYYGNKLLILPWTRINNSWRLTSTLQMPFALVNKYSMLFSSTFLFQNFSCISSIIFLSDIFKSLMIW